MRNPNLLLSDAAAPDNGLALGNVLQWFGGPFKATASGVFSGATVEVMACMEAPLNADRADYTTNPGDYDWVVVHTFTAPGVFELANLNPCGLAVRITNRHVNTRAKVILL